MICGDAGTIHVREAGHASGGAALARPKGERVLSSEVHDGLTIEITVPTTRTARRTLDALTRVSALRRSAAAAAELGPIRELRDRLRVVVAELGYGAHKRKDQRSAWEHSAELGRLQAEHGRIVGTVERIDDLRESIESAEELTIAALYEGEPAELYQDSAEEAHRELRVAIVDALLLENERHSLTVHLQEQDPRGALIPYLLTLLDDIADRGWRCSFHVYSDKEPTEVSWPKERSWGPPRNPAWMRRRLTAELEPGPPPGSERRFRDVLLCVEGRHAGALLINQLGLFRYDNPHVHEHKRDKEGRPAHLLVRFVAMRATIERSEWDRNHLKLQRPLRREELDVMVKRAHFDVDGFMSGALCPAKIALTPAEFWPRLEELMFTPLVERAFSGQTDEDQTR